MTVAAAGGRRRPTTAVVPPYRRRDTRQTARPHIAPRAYVVKTKNIILLLIIAILVAAH